MLIIRLESTLKDTKSNLFNKLIIFDSNNGSIKGIEILPTSFENNISKEELEQKFNIKINDDYRLIINDKVEDSYSFPFKIYLDITDKCQLNCKHCLTKLLNLENELSYNQIKSVIEECKEHGAFYVKLGGGEPFLHPDIFRIIKEFSDIGMRVSLSTNGLLINERIAEFLKKYYVKISVSIEGPKEVNNLIRGEGHYDKAIRAIKILNNAGCNPILRVTLTRYMLDEDRMLEMIALAKSLNVKLKISYCRPAGNAIDNELLIRYEDRQKYFNIIDLINSDEYQDLIMMDEGMQLVQDPELMNILYNDRICGSANRSFHINAAGTISPCVFLGERYKEKDSNYQKGDVLNYWNGSKGTKFKEVRKVNMPEPCITCDRLCKYECLATRLYFNDCFEKSDPNCLGGKKKCLKQK